MRAGSVTRAGAGRDFGHLNTAHWVKRRWEDTEKSLFSHSRVHNIQAYRLRIPNRKMTIEITVDVDGIVRRPDGQMPSEAAAASSPSMRSEIRDPVLPSTSSILSTRAIGAAGPATPEPKSRDSSRESRSGTVRLIAAGGGGGGGGSAGSGGVGGASDGARGAGEGAASVASV